MSHQLSIAVRNAQADALETTIGAAPIIEFRSGSKPADCATAASGTLLAQAALPSDWLTAASSGAKSKNGAWTFTAAAAGTIGYFRIYESGSPSVCHMQGSVTLTGAGGDMTVDDNVIGSAGQSITVNSFTYTRGNA